MVVEHGAVSEKVRGDVEVEPKRRQSTACTLKAEKREMSHLRKVLDITIKQPTNSHVRGTQEG